jgi:hypothetical protein
MSMVGKVTIARTRTHSKCGRKICGELDCRRGEYPNVPAKRKGETQIERGTEEERYFLSQDMFHLGMLCFLFYLPLVCNVELATQLLI